MLPPDGERITNLQSPTHVLQDVKRIKKTKGIALYESFELEVSHLNLMKRCLRVLILDRRGTINGECKSPFENLRFLFLDIYDYSWMDVTKHPRLAVFILKSDAYDEFCEF
ncbi:hypothetical protein SUGI_0104060 [Cryptomeria japonica]|nr:hypothetical protein SUGI_0104060 [Cryptomeria japonica]